MTMIISGKNVACSHSFGVKLRGAKLPQFFRLFWFLLGSIFSFAAGQMLICYFFFCPQPKNGVQVPYLFDEFVWILVHSVPIWHMHF